MISSVRNALPDMDRGAGQATGAQTIDFTYIPIHTLPLSLYVMCI